MPTLSRTGGSLAPRGGSGLKGRGIDERRQPELVRARSQPGLDAGDVARVDGQHQVGGGQRALDGAMAEPRRTLGAARRVRGLGDHIGHAERPGDDGAQPVGLAIVAMIGEPEIEAFGMTGRQASPAPDQAGRLRARAAFEREMRLRRRHAGRHPARAGITTVWPRRRSRRARPRAISRSPEGDRDCPAASAACATARACRSLRSARLWQRPCPSADAIQSTPESKEKRVRTISLARLARRRRKSGSPTRRASAAANSPGAPGATSRPFSPSVDEFADRRGAGRDDGEALVGRLHQHVGQAVLVAVGGLLAASTNRSARARAANTCLLRLGAVPECSARRCRARRPAPSAHRRARPPPICSKRQCSVARQLGQRVQEIVVALLLDLAADRQDDRRDRRGSLPSRRGRASRRRRQMGEVEAVIDELQPFRSRRQLLAAAAGPWPCRSPARNSRRAFPPPPTVRWSRCPWRAPTRSTAGRASWRRSASPRTACAGSGRRAVRSRVAARPPAPAPGPSAAADWPRDRAAGRRGIFAAPPA